MPLIDVENVDNNSAYLRGVLQGFNDVVYKTSLETWSTHFIRQIFMEYVPCGRPPTRCWDTDVNKSLVYMDRERG